MQLEHYKKDYNPYYDLYLKNLNSNEEGFKRLNKNLDTISSFFENLEEEKMSYTYSSDKWTISQVFQHIVDTERIFCFRALKIVREKNAQIYPYDHEAYAENCKLQSKVSILNDYKNNRKASITLFKTFDEDELKKSVNFGNYHFRVGLIPFIFCGHELHHLNIIKERYLK